MTDKSDERVSKSFDEWIDALPDVDQRAFQSRRSYMAGYAAALAAPAEPPKDGEVALIVDRLRGWANYDSPPADHKWSLLQEDLREAIARLVWRN